MSFKKLPVLFFILFLLLISGIIFAGSLTAPSTPEPTMYTLGDIYDLINDGATTTEASHDLAPTEAPAASPYSISEIYVSLANLIQATELRPEATYLGVTGGEAQPDDVTEITKEFDPTSDAGTITGFTLQDIANLIEGTRATTTAHESFAPSSDPADSGLTLTEIYTNLSILITASDIATGTTYLGVTGTYVAPATLVSLEITTPANTLEYTVGDSLDITGLVVTGTYSDNSTSTESITEANVTGFDSTEATTGQVLTITVDDVTVTYTVDIVEGGPCSGTPFTNSCATLTESGGGMMGCIAFPFCSWNIGEFCEGTFTCSDISDELTCTSLSCTWSP